MVSRRDIKARRTASRRKGPFLGRDPLGCGALGPGIVVGPTLGARFEDVPAWPPGSTAGSLVIPRRRTRLVDKARSGKGHSMKVYPSNWRVRLTTGMVVGACMAAAMSLGPKAGIHGFWPGGLGIIVAIVIGIVLGNLIGRLLFPPSSGDPPNRPPPG